MINTYDLEMKIYFCIIKDGSFLGKIDFDEKYFKTKEIITHFKKIYAKYKYFDVDLLMNNGNSIGSINFLEKITEYDVPPIAIYGYYQKLKDIYRDNFITKIADDYKNAKIDYKQFITQMNYINNQDEFNEDEILTVDEIDEPEKIEREYTNIRELDYLLKGIEYGKLSLWSGITNHGKTTLMIQFAKECIKKKKKIFYFSGEQTASEFKNYLYVGMCAKEQLDFVTDEVNNKIYDVKPKKQIKEYLDNLYKDYIYLYNNNITENNILTMLRVMQKAFNKGIRIFFIDNFMQLDNSEKLEEQTRIVESFKRFARNNNVIINLVAHPRKTQFQKNRLTIFDISGTQNIANKSANICTIIRVDLLPDQEKEEIGRQLLKNGYNINNCDGIVEVLKTKGNSCKMVGLKYDFDRKVYFEAQKENDEKKWRKREV